MSIMTMEMRGLRGDVPEEFAAAIRRATSSAERGLPLTILPGATSPTSLNTGVPSAGSLLSQYGPTVGAGLAGLIVGLVLAKIARRRKKG